MDLRVDNLPANRLALTNCIYISPNNFVALASKTKTPESLENVGSSILVSVDSHVYTACGHPRVPDDVVALNGLHRRFSQLTLLS